MGIFQDNIISQYVYWVPKIPGHKRGGERGVGGEVLQETWPPPSKSLRVNMKLELTR